MTWFVDWTRTAGNDLAELDPKTRRRVFQTIEKYATTGHADVKRLKGSDQYRLRVGDWRVRFEALKAERKLRILRVLHRREAYR